MNILPLMLFVSLFLGLISLAAFIWGIGKKQFDDSEKSRYLALEDDELTEESDSQDRT